MLGDAQRIEETEVFGHDSDDSADGERVLLDVDVVDADFSGVRREEGGEDFKESGFSGAVGADEGAYAFGDFEGDVIYGGQIGEAFGDVGAVDHGVWGLYRGEVPALP